MLEDIITLSKTDAFQVGKCGSVSSAQLLEIQYVKSQIDIGQGALFRELGESGELCSGKLCLVSSALR